MDRKLDIGAEDLLALLDVPDAADGLSVTEMAKAKGRSDDWVRAQLHIWIERGEVEYAGRKPIQDISRRTVWVPAYRKVKNE